MTIFVRGQKKEQKKGAHAVSSFLYAIDKSSAFIVMFYERNSFKKLTINNKNEHEVYTLRFMNVSLSISGMQKSKEVK